ncbi:MAG: methyltransferase [Bacteroidales bacterium]|nr:methyltransferase [Bacteroidales bacterium]
MSNNWFQFKQFKINQDKTAMKVGVDGVLLGAVSHFGQAKTVLDIGAGTGLLSFMSAQKTNAEIIALEIEKDAFNQCVGNVKLNKKQDRIRVLNISFQEFYQTTQQKFDFIICNPPFFENSEKSKNESKNVARHSDSLPKEDLVQGISKLLNFGGTFSVILPFEFEKSFEKLCSDYGLFCNRKLIVFPKSDKLPNRIIFEFSQEKYAVKTGKIVIRENDTNQYTKEYKKLTKDFYLHL